MKYAQGSTSAAAFGILPARPLPPASNTGAEIPRDAVGSVVSVDWLAFTFKRDTDRGEVAAFLSTFVPGEFVDAERGLMFYGRRMVGPAGALILWGPGRDDVHVELPGKWCKALGEGRLRDLLVALLGHSVGWTRVDLALDDFDRVVLPSVVYDRASAGELVTHVHRQNVSRLENLAGGQSFGLGRRGSRQYLRVYDKLIESGGATPAVRWELETRDEAATSLVAALVAPQAWGVVWASRLVQFCDFRVANGANSDRRPRVDWFVALVGSAEKAQVYDPQAVRTLEQAAEWVARQVAPTLAALMRALPDGWTYLAEILQRGEANWRPRHYALMATAGMLAG